MTTIGFSRGHPWRSAPINAVLIGLVSGVLGCASPGHLTDIDFAKSQQYVSGDNSIRGYRYAEAKQFIEFCVELDNQDDRFKSPSNAILNPQIDDTLWNPHPVYDSRAAIADDVFRYSQNHDSANDEHWSKLFDQITALANRKYPKGWSSGDIARDPDLNGFGPWQNAWLLYEGRGGFAGSYAIAIRGTVFSNHPSVAEDAWFHVVTAREFLSHAVQFADAQSATVHSGFAHSTFSLMLDDRYGVLRILHDRNVPSHSHLYVVGHSQGAAMATLAHAFLHYAMRNDSQSGEILGLRGKDYKLKSYGFAQPKPGNAAFSADFASITQRTGSAIVINNHIDPVPQVPFTLEASGDLEDNFSISSLAVRLLHSISGLGKDLRLTLATIAEPFVKRSARGFGYFYQYDELKPIGADKTAASWNFNAAGNVLFVFGTPGDPNDVFFQHHATTYRELIRQQLAP